MAALKQVRFTLATDDAIEELRNGAKKINATKSVILVKCVEDVVPRNEYYKSFGNQRTHTSRTVQIILKEFYAKVKNKYDLLALPPHKFCHVYILLLNGNHMAFLIQFGINLHSPK